MPKFYEWDAEKNNFELVDTEKAQCSQEKFFNKLDCRNSLIGLCFKKSANLALLMNNVRNSENAFCWLDPMNDDQYMKNRCLKMRVKLILSENQLNWPTPMTSTFDEENGLWIASLPYSDNLNVFGVNFVYSICTSGTTNEPKTVLVPPEAIMPNVHDFVERFNLNASSKLAWSTSLDFDPSFLELLLAFETDCSLFIVEDFDLKRIWRFSQMISIIHPNFLQITPAVLSLFSTDFLNELFGPSSSVENLLIGGDTFPTSLILRHAQSCSTRIFNVYGLTEVSCWASCTQFDPKIDTVADSSDTIRDTRLLFGEGGVEIYGRTCVVNGEKRKSVQTGDQFIRIEDNGKTKFVITSRMKINGTVITREVEQFLQSSYNFVDAVRLVVFNEQLFVFVKRTNASGNIVIPEKFNIKSIFYVDEFPITTNGKIEDTILRKHIQTSEKLRGFTGTVIEYLRNNPQLQQSDFTIASLGFSSRDLFEFIYEITKENMPKTDQIEEVRRTLFHEKTPASILFQLIADCTGNETLINESIELKTIENVDSYSMVKKFEMKQCVDFSAQFHKNKLFVGDMSGCFKVFDTINGQVLFENHHDSAVISQPLIHFNHVVYCTVDGQVHWLNLSEFKLKSILAGPSIRSKPCVFDELRIFIATFSTDIALLDLSNGYTQNVCDLNAGGIRNSPLVGNQFVVVATIDGVISGFHEKTLDRSIWRIELKKSVFAPLFELQDNNFGLVTLDGDLHIMTISEGTIIKTLNFNASCSIQPTVLPNSKQIVIPCSKDLIKVVNFSTRNGQLTTTEESYKLPAFLHQSRIVYSPMLNLPVIKCTTPENSCCKLLGLNFTNHTVKVLLELDAPSFGDPLIISKNGIETIFIGARDNLIYMFVINV